MISTAADFARAWLSSIDTNGWEPNVTTDNFGIYADGRPLPGIPDAEDGPFRCLCFASHFYVVFFSKITTDQARMSLWQLRDAVEHALGQSLIEANANNRIDDLRAILTDLAEGRQPTPRQPTPPAEALP